MPHRQHDRPSSPWRQQNAQGPTPRAIAQELDRRVLGDSSYRARGTFIMNSTTAAEIRKLKDDNDQNLWQPGLSMGQPDRLLGYPVSIWEQMDSSGSNTYPSASATFAAATR